MNDTDRQPEKRRSWFRRHPILTGILALFVVVIAGSALGGNSKPTTPAGTQAASGTPVAADDASPAAPIVVSKVTEIGDDFEANQVAAERKWAGKFVQFTATVTNIKSSGVSFGKVASKFSFTQISCDLEDENVLATLSKGKPATVRGVVGDDQILGVIRLNECQVVG